MSRRARHAARHPVVVALGAVALLLTVRPSAAVELAIESGSRVSFDARITGGSFAATTQALAGVVLLDETGEVLEAATIRARADAFDSGLRLRDSHMRDKYLQAAEHPEIVLEVAKQPVAARAGAQTALDAVLSVKGVKKAVKVPVRVEKDEGGRLTVTSEFPLDVREFGIPQPAFAVVKMEPVIQVKVALVLARKK